MKGKTASSTENGVEVEQQIKLSGHKWQVSSLAFSINGVYFASGSWDKTVRVWDLRVLTTSKEMGNGENGHTAPVTSVSWFPNVEFLVVSASADETLRIWNSESGERLSVLNEHTGWVLGTSFNFCGTVLASASWDKTVGIWDIDTLKVSQMLQGHTAGVWKAEFRSLDGDNVLCTASEDSSIKIWDLRTQSKWKAISSLVGVHDDGVKCCAWSSCGNYVAAGSADNQISVWDIRENRVINILQGHTDTVTDVKFSPQVSSKGSQILVSVGDTTCRFWDALSSHTSKQLNEVRQHDFDNEVECLELSIDGTLIATGGRDNKVVLSTLSIDEKQLHKFSHSQVGFAHKEAGFIRLPHRVSSKSSALLVDNTLQQNELIENEKAKQIAKQTVKIKSTGASDLLQNKLMGLKSGKDITTGDNSSHGELKTTSSVKGEDLAQRANKQLTSIPDRDYDVHEESSIKQPRQQQQVHEVNKNSNSLYENGFILSSVKNLALSPEVSDPGSFTALGSSYNIDDVANELIRLSEEQESYDAQL